MSNNKDNIILKSRLGGGFESADHIAATKNNSNGIRIDSHKQTDHDILVNQDYAMLKNIGIETVRDGFQWYLIERKKGQYNYKSLDNLVDAANRNNQQVIWDLLHYGTPDYLYATDPDFPERFAELSYNVAMRVDKRNKEWGNNDAPIYCPTNEISYFSYAFDQHHMYPQAKREGRNVKHQLIKANIASKKAVLSADPRARFIDVDPIINIVARPDASQETRDQIGHYNNAQYEAWDMIAGRIHPELGGGEEYLDIVGANFYYNGQWIHDASFDQYMEFNWHENHKPGSAEPFHKEWTPLNKMLGKLHERFNRPIYLSETGHFRERRGHWMDEINSEMYKSIQNGVPLIGACLYPVIDRYDWNPEKKHLHMSGLFDLQQKKRNGLLSKILDFCKITQNGVHQRVIDQDYFAAVKRTQQMFKENEGKILDNLTALTIKKTQPEPALF